MYSIYVSAKILIISMIFFNQTVFYHCTGSCCPNDQVKLMGNWVIASTDTD